MLYFQERPDEVFQAIVRESLALAKAELTDTESHPQTCAPILPKTQQVLTLGPTLAAVDELLGVLDRSEVYEVRPMHRLIISDAVQRYCETYNRRPHGGNVRDRYGITAIRSEPLCRIFLQPFDSAFREGFDQARTEALQLLLLGDPSWHVPIAARASPWYRPHEAYPVCDANAQ